MIRQMKLKSTLGKRSQPWKDAAATLHGCHCTTQVVAFHHTEYQLTTSSNNLNILQYIQEQR